MDCVGLAGLCDQRNRHPKGFPVRTLMTSGVDRMWFLGKRADVFMRGRDRAISQVNVAIQRLEEKLSDAEELTSGRLLRTYESQFSCRMVKNENYCHLSAARYFP